MNDGQLIALRVKPLVFIKTQWHQAEKKQIVNMIKLGGGGEGGPESGEVIKAKDEHICS